MKKSIVSLFAVPVLVFGLSACGSDDTVTETPNASASPADEGDKDMDKDDMDKSDDMDKDMDKSEDMDHSDDMDKDMDKDDMDKDAKSAGSYVDYAEYESKGMTKGNDTVLFFHATWCPDCQATDAALKADGVPAGIDVVKVDFDDMTDLKKKYGVVQQTTFVQIDEDGNEVKKWAGSPDGAAIAKEVQG